MAANLNNLAELYQEQGQYAKAEPLYQRSLKIWEKALGPDHPHVAVSLNNLATLYYNQEQYAKAEPLYQRALKIWEKALGPDHPDVANALEGYADLLNKMGRDKEAASCTPVGRRFGRNMLRRMASATPKSKVHSYLQPSHMFSPIYDRVFRPAPSQPSIV